MSDDPTTPRYPDLAVQLTGIDGNAFQVLGTCKLAMLEAGLSNEDVREFMDQACAGDYDHLLRVCAAWFDVR